MTTSVSLSGEDIPLLAGVALAIAGTALGNTEITVAGLALIGGKAFLHSTPPEPKAPA